MKLFNYGHSCFGIFHNDTMLLFDPYKDNSVPNLTCPTIFVDNVFISHEHDDHNARDKAIIKNNCSTNYGVETLKTFHDKEKGRLRGENIVHKIKMDGITIAHLGDLGEIDENLISFLKDVDILLCPLNGFYTIGAKEAVELLNLLNPSIFIPMHYFKNGSGYEDNNQIDIFKKDIKQFISVYENEIDLNIYLNNEHKVIIFERS